MKERRFFEKFYENISKLDDTRIKNVFELIDQERLTFRSILDALDEAIFLISKDDMKIHYLNKKAFKFINSSDIKYPLNIEEFGKICLSKDSYNVIFEFINEKENTKEFFCSTYNRYFTIDKSIIKSNDDSADLIILKINDITEQRKLEHKLKNFESISALNTLAAGIAHEIKNPLTSIDLHTQILKKGIQKKIVKAPNEVNQYINIVEEETARLMRIVSDFLTTARKRELKLTYEDPANYIDSILSFLRPEFDEYAINLSTDYNSSPNINIDKEYFRQALINIFKNSIDAIRLKKEKENSSYKPEIKIKLDYNPTSDIIIISIYDNGIGIEKDVLPKIFEPFYTTKEYGTGLGLTIVYKIIKEHLGDIRIDSKVNKGTNISIQLPTQRGVRLING